MPEAKAVEPMQALQAMFREGEASKLALTEQYSISKRQQLVRTNPTAGSIDGLR